VLCGRDLVVRLPRRHPRTVYEVYDAEERLGVGEQEQPEGALAHDPGGAFAGRGPAVEGIALPGALRRMPASALLCTAVVCVLAAIAVVLLHALSGAGTGRRLLARMPRTSRTTGGALRQGAGVEAVGGSLGAREPARKAKPSGVAGLEERAGRALPAAQRSLVASPAPRRGAAWPMSGGSSWSDIAPSRSQYAPVLAVSGTAPTVQAPSASKAADLEFGFER
jgi:hypothetical protein